MHKDYNKSYSHEDGVCGPNVTEMPEFVSNDPSHVIETTPSEAITLELHDRIELGGMEGTVIAVDDHDGVWECKFPVTVKFDCGLEMTLTRDGKQFSFQRYSLVKKLGVKQKPKIQRWQWLVECKYNGTVVTALWMTEEEINDCDFKKVIRKIEETVIEKDQ